MKCLQCGREHQNEGGRCSTYATPIQLATLDRLNPDQTTRILPKSLGICLDRGTEPARHSARTSNNRRQDDRPLARTWPRDPRWKRPPATYQPGGGLCQAAVRVDVEPTR